MCVFKIVILGFVLFGFTIMKGASYFTIVIFLFNFRFYFNLIKFKKVFRDFTIDFLGKDYKDLKLYICILNYRVIYFAITDKYIILDLFNKKIDKLKIKKS
mgnify:CR=1 FL=1